MRCPGGYAIAVSNLTKKYGEIEAVRGISFKVKCGEVFGFLGPNGAGKTTTIHILATLLKPTSGEARVAGYDVVREPDRVRRAIGIVFQDPALDDQLTAYENMYIHGLLYGMKGEELESRIDELLEFVELKPFRDKQVKTFSGGMRRRLEMARALLHKPAVLFLDEPTIGLDPQSRAKIWDYIEKMRSEHEVTVFLTTHYMDEAEKLADRIAIIDHGKIVAEGTPEQLKSIVGEDVVYVELDGLHGQGGDPCGHFVRLEGVVKSCTAVKQEMIVLKVADASRSIPKVLDAAARGSLVVKSVSYKRPTLNDVFLYLTGRELRDEGISPSDHMKMVMRLRRRWPR